MNGTHICRMFASLSEIMISSCAPYGLRPSCATIAMFALNRFGNHCLTCKKGGHVIRRHHFLRDLIAEILDEVCSDVEVEPPLLYTTPYRSCIKVQSI